MTEQDIVKALRCPDCGYTPDNCEYLCKCCGRRDPSYINEKAAALIEQITARAEKAEAENAELRRELEAAIADITFAVGGERCKICINDKCHYKDDEEIVACSESMFKWRRAGKEGEE